MLPHARSFQIRETECVIIFTKYMLYALEDMRNSITRMFFGSMCSAKKHFPRVFYIFLDLKHVLDDVVAAKGQLAKYLNQESHSFSSI